MYTRHFDLKYKPFDLPPDPRFLWLNEEQRREMAYLRHVLLTQSGFVLITGGVGTGKTILANGLARLVDKSATVVTVPDPDMEKLDFFNYLADGFGLKQYFNSKADFLISLKHLSREMNSSPLRFVLIIDEAHRLSSKMLQEIRLLANIQMGDRFQLSTVLIGLPEMLDALQQEHNHNVLQRIAARVNLAPLNLNEMRLYILYRLRIAGSARGIFTDLALERIHEYSGGNQRLINLLCDHALVTGYAADKKKIDSKIVGECISDLNISLFCETGVSGDEETPTEDYADVYEALSIDTGPARSSFFSNGLSWIRNFCVVFATVMLIFFAGYSLWGRLFDLPSSEVDNEQAVQEMVRVLDLQTERQVSEFASERAFGHEMGNGPGIHDSAEERSSADPLDTDPADIRKKIEVPATVKIKNSEGLNF